jgi:hypothetical protein
MDHAATVLRICVQSERLSFTTAADVTIRVDLRKHPDVIQPVVGSFPDDCNLRAASHLLYCTHDRLTMELTWFPTR